MCRERTGQSVRKLFGRLLSPMPEVDLKVRCEVWITGFDFSHPVPLFFVAASFIREMPFRFFWLAPFLDEQRDTLSADFFIRGKLIQTAGQRPLDVLHHAGG